METDKNKEAITLAIKKGVENMLKSTVNRGFQMEFKNGVEISVQWGHGNYCSNRDLEKGYNESLKSEIFSGENAEVLITQDSKSITRAFAKAHDINCSEHEDAIGWLSPDEVADAIHWAKNY